MPDARTIPFKQADPNGHYRSKQLPYDKGDFLEMLELPAYPGDVTGPAGSTAGQLAAFDDGTGKRLGTFTGTGIVKTVNGVANNTPAPGGDLVGTTDVQVLTNKTLNNVTINGLTGLTKADVGLANVDNTSDVNKPISTATASALTAKEDKTSKGAANGYASLDASTKIPMSQIPDALVGASQYQGTWNASTNTPTIPAAAVGNKGWYYSVSVAGTTNINGINSWAVGDTIISNGAAWQKIPNVDSVTSVAGKTGIVTLVKADVGLNNVDNTADSAKPVSTAQQTALNLKQDTASKGLAGGYAGLDGAGKVPAAQLPTAPVTTVAGRTGDVVLTKTDVGLGNVDNTSDATKNSAAVTLTNKTINGANNTLTVRLDADVTNNLPVARLNSGTGANSGSFWRGDGQWAPPAGGGDMVGPTLSVDGELPLYSGTSGKIVKRCNLSGFVKAVPNGAATSQAQIGSADIAPTAISGQTEKTALCDPEDLFLIVDKVTGQLRCVRSRWSGRLPSRYIGGLDVTNGTVDAINDIDVAAGECRDDTNSYDMILSSPLTKQLDAAWAAGTNAGMRDTGAIADGSWHVYLIMNPTTGVVDVVATTTYGIPTLPSGFTAKRRIFSIRRRTGALVGFDVCGDYVQFAAPVLDLNAATLAASSSLVQTLVLVPVGRAWLADVSFRFSHPTAGSFIYYVSRSVDKTAAAPLFLQVAGGIVVSRYTLMCNGTAQIYIESGTVPGTHTMHMSCFGYYDYRGMGGGQL
jgi:hypothetical protein